MTGIVALGSVRNAVNGALLRHEFLCANILHHGRELEIVVAPHDEIDKTVFLSDPEGAAVKVKSLTLDGLLVARARTVEGNILHDDGAVAEVLNKVVAKLKAAEGAA